MIFFTSVTSEWGNAKFNEDVVERFCFGATSVLAMHVRDSELIRYNQSPTQVYFNFVFDGSRLISGYFSHNFKAKVCLEFHGWADSYILTGIMPNGTFFSQPTAGVSNLDEDSAELLRKFRDFEKLFDIL